MKATEVITKLQRYVRQHGDVDVYAVRPDCADAVLVPIIGMWAGWTEQEVRCIAMTTPEDEEEEGVA